MLNPVLATMAEIAAAMARGVAHLHHRLIPDEFECLTG